MDQSYGPKSTSDANSSVTTHIKETPVEHFDRATTANPPFGSLSLGCDSKEDWEEELREEPCDSENEVSSPNFPHEKPAGRFTLVPRLSEHETSRIQSPRTEVNDEEIDLTTPHQSTNLLLDCPRRPAKGRRVSRTPSTERSSCRHLFLEEVSLSALSESVCPTDHKETRQQCMDYGYQSPAKNRQTIISGSSACHPITSLEGADLTKQTVQSLEDKAADVQGTEEPGYSCTPDAQLHAFKSRPDCAAKGGGLPMPIGSPQSGSSSSSSQCSDCTACSSNSPLSSPILSQIKHMSQTIESSMSDGVSDKEIVVTVVGPSEIISTPADTCAPSPENDLNSELAGNVDLKDSARAIPDKNTAVSGFIPVPDATEDSAENELISEEIFSTRSKDVVCDENAKRAKVESNQTISSVGSTSSNWTAVSGISPLPASDPIHFHKHGHHHRHHHRHHARHHHHHSSRHGRSLPRAPAMMMTSTPIHKKTFTAEKMDISPVTPTVGTEFSPLLHPKDSRFVVSSELQFTDSSPLTQNTGSEVDVLGSQEGSYQPMELVTSGIDKENIEHCSTRNPQEVFHNASHSLAVKEVPLQTDTKDKPAQTCQPRKRPREPSETDLENCCWEVEVGTGSTPNRFSIEIGADMIEKEITGADVNRYYMKKIEAARSTSRRRPLAKKEAEVLLQTQANFTDEIWDQLPSPRRASSVDECLFRNISNDAHLSVTLE